MPQARWERHFLQAVGPPSQRQFDKNPAKPKSDIDVGVVRAYDDPAWHAISDSRGFPVGAMSKVERRYAAGVDKELGRPTGIKFFDHDQIERDGRSYMVRPHTPPRVRPSGGTSSMAAASSSSGSGPGGPAPRSLTGSAVASSSAATVVKAGSSSPSGNGGPSGEPRPDNGNAAGSSSKV